LDLLWRSFTTSSCIANTSSSSSRIVLYLSFHPRLRLCCSAWLQFRSHNDLSRDTRRSARAQTRKHANTQTRKHANTQYRFSQVFDSLRKSQVTIAPNRTVQLHHYTEESTSSMQATCLSWACRSESVSCRITIPKKAHQACKRRACLGRAVLKA
jgi:hypothetical protein